eukprot:6872189-Prymnesium_polylepis.1
MSCSSASWCASCAMPTAPRGTHPPPCPPTLPRLTPHLLFSRTGRLLSLPGLWGRPALQGGVEGLSRSGHVYFRAVAPLAAARVPATATAAASGHLSDSDSRWPA